MKMVLRPTLALAFACAPLSAVAQGQEAKGADLSKPKKGLSLGNVAEAQAREEPARGRLDAAAALLRSEAYAQAAVELQEVMESEPSLADEARYQLAKALYRMGHHHSSLHHFALLLEKGPGSRHYKSSLEWCLFLSRKMVDDGSVNDVVARFATGEFSKEYRDEFLFRLARFHFARALAIETGAIAGQLGETRVEETVTGGMSFQGDLFGDPTPPPEKKPEPEPAPAPIRGKKGPAPKKAAPPAAPKVVKKEGGGLSFDDDLFGEPEKPKTAAAAAPDKGPAAAPAKPTLTAKEHTEAAQRFVMRVEEASKYGARAKYLEGLVLYKQGKENEALDAFKAVVRMTRDGKTKSEEKLREAAFFQLARTHFGAQQPSFSIFYYDKVDRDSWAWLDALYEASWAEFRLGSYEKALGNLLTLHSPFFEDQYYPESQILKAVIYYENCRYPEAKQILADFLKRYEPVLEELKRLTAKEMEAAQYYESLENLRSRDLAESQGEKAAILGQVLDIALSDSELTRLDRAYKEVSKELSTLEADAVLVSSRAGTQLKDVLSGKREELAREAGRAVRSQLEREREAIKTLIQQAIRIDIETSRSEQERIESQLRDVQSRPKRMDKTFVEWADDEKLVWPFEGEYWRDELGTYELTLAHSCR